MTNFNWLIDGSIVVLYLLGVMAAGLYFRRYIKKVDDFLVAGRSVDLYLGIASLSATEFGIATCMANAELGFKYGFAGITPGIALAVAMFIVGRTGFCIKPLREQKVITIPELFEQRFGEKVRWASGLVIVLGGLLNMGVFLRQAGDFLTLVLGIDTGYLELIMTVLLLGIALYTILGGMLSVLVTDYLQFIVMSIGLLSIVALIFYQFGWDSVVMGAQEIRGEAIYHPFGNHYGWDRITLDVLVAFAVVLTWQTMVSRVLAAKDAATAKKIYIGTSPFFLVRFAIPAFMGMAALYFFGTSFEQQSVLAMPQFLSQILPWGLLGLVVAAMLAADMSTNSSYMIAWSSVIYNDLLRPIHKGLWSHKQAISWNRWLIAGIGLFLLLYGLWYPLKGDLWVYMQVTGTIYLASMSVILIAACYWPGSNNWGAMTAIAISCVLPVGFLIMQQNPATQAWTEQLGPYKLGVSTYILTALGMLVASKLKPKTHPS